MTNEKEITQLIISVLALVDFARKANTIHLPEMIFVFKSERYLAYFDKQIKLDTPKEYLISGCDLGRYQYEFYGVKIKLRLRADKNSVDVLKEF